jgi:hypothetical protein
MNISFYRWFMNKYTHRVSVFQEEEAMLSEVAAYDTLIQTKDRAKVADLDFVGSDPRNPKTRPDGWDDLRNRRIAAKDVITGASKKFFQARQTQLEKTVCYILRKNDWNGYTKGCYMNYRRINLCLTNF